MSSLLHRLSGRAPGPRGSSQVTGTEGDAVHWPCGGGQAPAGKGMFLLARAPPAVLGTRVSPPAQFSPIAIMQSWTAQLHTGPTPPF